MNHIKHSFLRNQAFTCSTANAVTHELWDMVLLILFLANAISAWRWERKSWWVIATATVSLMQTSHPYETSAKFSIKLSSPSFIQLLSGITESSQAAVSGDAVWHVPQKCSWQPELRAWWAASGSYRPAAIKSHDKPLYLAATRTFLLWPWWERESEIGLLAQEEQKGHPLMGHAYSTPLHISTLQITVHGWSRMFYAAFKG